MGSVLGLALPLLFFCWEAGVTASSEETTTLAVRIPSNFMVVHPIPTDTSDTSATSSSPRTGTSSVKPSTERDPIEAIFDTLCTNDSSEEARKIASDLLTLAHTSTEAEHLHPESRSSSDRSAGVLTRPQVLGPSVTTPAKDSVAFSVTHIKLTTCTTEIETSIISGNLDTNHSPTGATALSTSETLTLPQSPEAKPLSPKITSSPGTPALASTLEGTLPISHVTETETTVPQIPTSGGTLVTVSMSTLKETSAFSTETQSHTEVLGTITVPWAARSTMGEATTFTGSLASDSSVSAGATTKSSATSEDITSSSFLTGSSTLSFAYSTTASTSKKPNITLAKPTASPKTTEKPPASTPTAAWTRTTKRDPEEDGGFLFVRLSVASPQDLTEPKATEKLIHQISCELHTHMPLVQVSLLKIRRG